MFKVHPIISRIFLHQEVLGSPSSCPDSPFPPQVLLKEVGRMSVREANLCGPWWNHAVYGLGGSGFRV